MILILSREAIETTTDQVIDWIEALEGDCVRLNGEDLAGGASFVLEGGSGWFGAVIRLGDCEVRSDEVSAVWYRRWHRLRDFPVPGIAEATLRRNVDHHLGRELRAVSEALYDVLGHARWLTTPAEIRLPKMRALRLAAGAGLDVPATAIVNGRNALQAFKDRHGRIITKCAGEVEAFAHSGRTWGLYTAELVQSDVDAAPESFFPTLVQERLEKRYEVRSFYLEGEFYSMAIFSQNDAQTELDFRRYNMARPNRNVPYRLPDEVRDALLCFVEAAQLTTGSFDLVRTRDGRLVFLEVNPAGQFGMVSQPCNYFLEKKVAEHLIRLDQPATSHSTQPT